MDLPFAVIWRVFMYLHSSIPKLILHPCTEPAEGKGREGRRFQGVRGVADQIPPVKRSPRPDGDTCICPRRLIAEV